MTKHVERRRTFQELLTGQQGRRLNLALQGGGAHGAFTWGVLDRLLAEDQLSFSWISGTSAGALNAVAVAHGLAWGSREASREALRGIWEAVERARVPDLLNFHPLAASMATIAGMFSPYNLNPLGVDPLRQILAEHIDFKAIRANKDVCVVMAATDVQTGKAQLFSGEDVTIDTVIASACLPHIHHAVMIDGRGYWDGGFSANPPVRKLAANSPTGDTLMVLLNPLDTRTVPRSAEAIEDRVNTITFNQPLIRDVEEIVRAQELQTGWFAPRHSRLARMKAHRFHLIDGSEHTQQFGPRSKIMPDRAVLRTLFQNGQEAGEGWLEAHLDDVGRRGTINLREHFMTSAASIAEAEEDWSPADAKGSGPENDDAELAQERATAGDDSDMDSAAAVSDDDNVRTAVARSA